MHRKYKATLAVARPVLGVVAGLFVLVFGAIASGAALHHALHHDANSHSGHCAVCSFAKSQVETADGSVVVCQPSVPVDVAAVPTISVLPRNPSFLLPPGRAPPVLSAVS